jgi:hypothetical protein
MHTELCLENWREEPHLRLRPRFEDKIKCVLNTIWGRRLDWSGSGLVLVAGSYVHGNEFSGFFIDGEFLDWVTVDFGISRTTLLYMRVGQKSRSHKRTTPSLSNTHTVHELSGLILETPCFLLFHEEEWSSRNSFPNLATKKHTSLVNSRVAIFCCLLLPIWFRFLWSPISTAEADEVSNNSSLCSYWFSPVSFQACVWNIVSSRHLFC